MAKKKNQTDSSGARIQSTAVQRKSFHVQDLISIQPKSKNQELLFNTWIDSPDKSFFLYGSAGTGKTFLSLYLALHQLLDKDNHYHKLYIIRSTVPTRDVGFLPGDLDEKVEVYEQPYIQICDDIFPYKKAYDNMKAKGLIEFLPTAFLRGITFDNSIILVDEAQNMSWAEISTVMTRVGKNSRIIFCGDNLQTDEKARNGNGFLHMLDTVKRMRKYFVTVKFSHNDIVRSGIVKDFIIKSSPL